MCPGQLRGCKRGVYGLSSWEPLRKPGEDINKPAAQVAHVQPQERTSATETDMASNKNGGAGDIKKGRPMLVKYKYPANKNSPLGKELDVQMGDKLKFIEYHPQNDCWILAQNTAGDEGYVPANYTQFVEEERGLPWLKNREPEESKANNAFGAPANGSGYKGYKPTYVHKDLPQSGNASSTPEYYCEICEKQLNGPKPYQAHLASKAHREELDFRNGES